MGRKLSNNVSTEHYRKFTKIASRFESKRLALEKIIDHFYDDFIENGDRKKRDKDTQLIVDLCRLALFDTIRSQRYSMAYIKESLGPDRWKEVSAFVENDIKEKIDNRVGEVKRNQSQYEGGDE